MRKQKRTCKKTEFYHPLIKEKKKRIHKSEINDKCSPMRRIIPKEDLLVWGRCRGYGWWPGRIANRTELRGPIDPPDDPTRWIKWFGDYKFSETRVDQMAYFHDFSLFKENVYLRNVLYQQAIDQALELAATRAGHTNTTRTAAVEWAKSDFLPGGYVKILPDFTSDLSDSMGVKVFGKELRVVTNVAPQSDGTFNNLKEAIKQVNKKQLKLENVCLGCGSLEVRCPHPIFQGGLCDLCQVDFGESVYLVDDQGYYMYCCVCGGGDYVITCDDDECGRCFCKTCMNALVHEKAFEEVSNCNTWKCYLCVEKDKHKNLIRRQLWEDKLLKLMNQDQTIECSKIHPIPSSLPRASRRPCRVLSLFDGIATGYHVLELLKIDIECYYASEIDHEAICVAKTRHPNKMHNIGNVYEIDDALLQKLGPFDLVIGGSPCNDLSIVNPARKGIWSDKGSGCLFFEYVRILHSCQLMAALRGKPLFWMFENVVCMDNESKAVITRFLQRNPVCLNAKVVSPANRPRYYWGNLPGMNRPMVAAAYHKLTVQDCLEPGRTAITEKLRTITTKVASVRQIGSNAIVGGNAVVLQEGEQKDSLWITEIERVFGFPDHYTDVCNMSRGGRLRVLGKSWSVPVIKHLFTPLKDYFASF